MEKEISIFVPEDKKLLQQIYENVDELIKDSDNNAEKQIVKSYLQTLSQRLEIAVIGKSGSGKTTLLNKLLQEELLRGEELKPTIGIREYRDGAEERVYRLENEHWRVFSCSQVLQGLAVYDSQGIDTISENGRTKLKDIVKKCAITLVVLSAESIRDYSVWNFVEKIDCKHMVFIQTKCDLVTKEECERNTERIKQYLSEIGMNAPVFHVTDMITPDGEVDEGYAQLSHYVSDNIIGENPILTNQYNNITSLRLPIPKIGFAP